MPATTMPHPTDRTAVTAAEDAGARAARWGDSPRGKGVPGLLALVMVAVAFGFGAAMARPAAAAEPSVGLGFGGGIVAQAPECVPVPGAECGSVRVPLFRSRPGGATIDIAYALIRHRDPALPVARGTVVFNPGGPGGNVIDGAAGWTELLAGLLGDHDLLLIDPRGTGRSHPLDCGVQQAWPATRQQYVQAVGRCGKRLGGQARAYTSAATADDFEAVRAHLGIPKLDLYGVSYGTYLMTVFAQRHPTSVRSIVLSSAFPLRFDMWARANVHAMRLAIRRVCERSTTGKCDGARTLRQLGRLARRLRAKPIPYRVDGERRVVDDTALAGIAYWSDVDIGKLPAIVRAALRGDTGPLIAAAGALARFTGSQVPGTAQNVALAFAIGCNDYPTLWDRHASIPVRERQFAARRARLDQSAFRPFTESAWTSAITDRGNTCIRWPDRHGPVQRTSGPFPDVPVLVTSGDLDANTPTAEGRQAARQFPHAQVVEVPNRAHGPELEPTGCVFSIIFDFIRNQHVGDTSCLANIPPVPVT